MATASVADLWSEIEEEEDLLSKGRKGAARKQAVKLAPAAKVSGLEKPTKRARKVVIGESDPVAPAKRVRKVEPKDPLKGDASNAEPCGAEAAKKKAASSARSLPKTKLARDIIENLAKFPHCILLTRVGQFYESYFDQAPEVASMLNIKLAQRRWGVRGRIVQMAGFPLAHLDRHLKTLVQTEKRFVALCEEFRKPNAPLPIPGARNRGYNAPSPFERRVVRVVTPGTLIDESFVNPYDNNYVCAVVSANADSTNIGIAWMDVATGEFFTQLSDPSQLADDLARISAREIVLDESLEGPEHADHPIRKGLADGLISVAYCDTKAEPTTAPLPLLSPPPSTDNITAVSASAEIGSEQLTSRPVFTPAETLAIQLISSFLQANLRESMPMLEAPVRVQEDAGMQIDAHTVRALEIQKGAQGESNTGSLLSVVRRTVTSSGSRLLSRWLCGPSTSVTEIQARQALVALFHGRAHLRRDILVLLRQTGDAIRLVQKLQLRRGDADDLLAIAETIGVHSEIAARLRLELKVSKKTEMEQDQFLSLSLLLGRVSDLSKLAKRIGTAVHVTTPILGESELRRELPSAGDTESDGASPDSKNWSIKPDFDPELHECHKRFKKLKAQEEGMQRRLRIEYSVPTLALKMAPPHGIFVHVSNTNTKKYGAQIRTPPEFIPLSKSGSTESFFYKPWSELGTSILECQAEIFQAERNALEALRTEVGGHAIALRRNARIIDEIDVTVGFAELASEMNFVRPVVNDSLNFLTVNGRHPAIELGLLTSGRVFTPNTVNLGSHSRLMLITGPNMAGKSTVLRQSALIAILAQTGSFVPADSAEIGVVDRVFSRIGARDDLFRDRSTFMVEMLEAGEILRRATNRSLVIMDEVGRGTTVRDGLAIAFATAHHLHAHNQCRAMFATHFHEVADMLGYIESPTSSPPASDDLPISQCTRPHISFFCTSITTSPDSPDFSYAHRLRPGVNRESHGLRVAQLGGMPEAAIDVARRVMERLRGGEVGVQADAGLGRDVGVGLGLGLGMGVGNREIMRRIGEGF